MARVEIYESCNDTVAHLGGVRRTLKHTADKGAAVAKGVLMAHRAEGHSRITVTRGDRLDYFVNLDDTRGQSRRGGDRVRQQVRRRRDRCTAARIRWPGLASQAHSGRSAGSDPLARPEEAEGR
jgi:hypothetical protein